MQGIELIDHLAQIILLAHGWHKVARVAESLDSRQGHSIFPVKEYSSKTLPADIEFAFERLKELDGGQDANIYTQAITSLKSVFARLEKDEEGKENPHAALDWVITLPEQFVGLMKARKEIALVILGFYSVVLDQVAQVWWLRGWSRDLFGVVWSLVNSLHRDVLRWPQEIIKFES